MRMMRNLFEEKGIPADGAGLRRALEHAMRAGETLVLVSDCPARTEQIGEVFGALCTGREVVALSGGLGAGKTAFVRGVARVLGAGDEVSSPTFALVHQYQGRCPVYHFDMYRITGWEDLDSTGFFDFLGVGVLLIEWSENIEGALPADSIRVAINPTGEQTRSLCFHFPQKEDAE